VPCHFAAPALARIDKYSLRKRPSGPKEPCFGYAPGRNTWMRSATCPLHHFPACRPRKRRNPLPLRIGPSQSSRKNRTLLPSLQPATRPPLKSRFLNRLRMIPSLFPSLAYSGPSLSLSLPIYVFTPYPPDSPLVKRSHSMSLLFCRSRCWRLPGLILTLLFLLFYLPYPSLPD
jgi:hypothetical protein